MIYDTLTRCLFRTGGEYQDTTIYLWYSCRRKDCVIFGEKISIIRLMGLYCIFMKISQRLASDAIDWNFWHTRVANLNILTGAVWSISKDCVRQSLYTVHQTRRFIWWDTQGIQAMCNQCEFHRKQSPRFLTVQLWELMLSSERLIVWDAIYQEVMCFSPQQALRVIKSDGIFDSARELSTDSAFLIENRVRDSMASVLLIP